MICEMVLPLLLPLLPSPPPQDSRTVPSIPGFGV
jgi:hypothetical protein